jgi:endogenous inhibitor of DNA gyrase (YacG/DUF329 family)
MAQHSKPLWQTSGAASRIWIARGIVMLCAVAYVLTALYRKKVSDYPWLPISLLAIGGGAMAWFWISVKCPRCGLRLARRVATTASILAYDKQLRSMVHCPECGYPNDRSEKANEQD